MEREEVIKKSQKLLLTWLIERPGLYGQIKGYISPEDFTEGLYYDAARLLFEQFETGNIVPAKIINHFTDTEKQKEAASLFNTSLRVETKAEMEKALRETLYRVRSHGIAQRRQKLAPTDMAGLQRSIAEERKLAEIKRLHISLE